MTLRGIDLEYKLGVLLGTASLFISLLLGLISGNTLVSALVKSVAFMFIFIVVGFGSGYVLKRFVPEVYEILSARGSGEEQRPAEDGADADFNGASIEGVETAEGEADRQPRRTASEEFTDGAEDAGAEEKFVPTGSDGYEKLSTADAARGKLGKHLFEEKKIKYEPKIMAAAIKTMMSRDND